MIYLYPGHICIQMIMFLLFGFTSKFLISFNNIIQNESIVQFVLIKKRLSPLDVKSLYTV